MKVLVVLCALAACASAKPGFAYSAISPLGLSYGNAYGYGIGAPYGIGASYLGAPALHSYAAAPLLRTIAAPAVHAVAAPAIAPAPVAVAHAAPAVAVAPAVATGIKTQYHAQDELGQASYGHTEPGQVHHAVQDAHGNKVGSFSYVNPTDGLVHRTDYVADAHGYRVAANDLPAGPALPIADTPEVAAAKLAHLSAHRARRSAVLLAQTPASTAPLAHAVVAHAPIAYAAAPAVVAAPAVHAAPLAYAAAPAVVAAPAVHAAPLAYAAAAPAVVAGHAVRDATLTTIVNNPGHAVSYRVD